MELTNAQTGAATDSTPRIAIVGYGGMGRWHGWKLSTLDCLELAGVYDIAPEAMEHAREKEIPVYDSFEAVLADESVSLVTVAIPNHLHKNICIRLMEAGKHVICEKPVALSSAELQEMIDAANRCPSCHRRHCPHAEGRRTPERDQALARTDDDPLSRDSLYELIMDNGRRIVHCPFLCHSEHSVRLASLAA